MTDYSWHESVPDLKVIDNDLNKGNSLLPSPVDADSVESNNNNTLAVRFRTASANNLLNSLRTARGIMPVYVCTAYSRLAQLAVQAQRSRIEA